MDSQKPENNPLSVKDSNAMPTSLPTRDQFIQARVHLGHLAKNWHPTFKPFLFKKEDNRHFINVDQTARCLAHAGEALRRLLSEGKKVLFVGRKEQAKEIVEEIAKELEQPYMTHCWVGGTLTNFHTTKSRLRKLTQMEKQEEDPVYQNLTKKEKLSQDRRKEKIAIALGGIKELRRLPAAIFLVDVNRNQTPLKEAQKLNIPIFAIVDSNASAEGIDYPIPGNDDTRSAITLILNYLKDMMALGLKARKETKLSREKEVTAQQMVSFSDEKAKSDLSKPVNASSRKVKEAAQATSTSEKEESTQKPRGAEEEKGDQVEKSTT